MVMTKKVIYKKLSEEKKKEIVREYYSKKYLTFRELSDLLNVSERSISQVLKELNINTKRRNRYTINEKFFSNIDTEEKAYILGMIYADGFVGNEHYNNIVLGLKDRELVQTIADIMEFSGEIRVGKKGGFENSSESYVLNFSSAIMANDLRKLGLYPNKSLTIAHLPNLENNLMRHFIRGYFDGDGSIILSQHTSYHMVANEKKKYIYPAYTFMLLGTEKFLLEIPDYINVEYYSITNTKTELIKCLRVCAKCELKKLFGYLYDDSTLFLQRKYNKWLEVLSAFMM